MALAATAEYFSEDDSACKILPVVCPLIIDKEKLARDQANRTLDVYLQKVRKAAASLPETALPPSEAVEGQPARMGTPQSSGSSSWTGWAISSFTNKVSAAAGNMQTANGLSTTGAPPTPSPGPEAKKLTTASASSLHLQVVKPSPPPGESGLSSPTASAVAEAFFPEADADDGADTWGDMDDMIDDDGEADTSFATATAASKAPAATASSTPFDDGEPDFAGWLAAQSQKKIGGHKPLPKGLSKPTPAKKPAAKAGAKQAVAKKIDLKPKVEESDDDGWGDGW